MATATLPELTVTAAEISRNFGHWQSQAMSAPVAITYHGRARLVLSSVEDFEAAQFSKSAEGAAADGGRVNAQLHAVLGQMRDSFLAFDGRMKIIDANAAAELYIGVARDQLIGRDLRDVVPTTTASIAWDHLARVLRTRQCMEFRARSTIRQGERINFQAFPYDGDGVAIIFANLASAEEASVYLRRLEAMQAAFRAEGEVASVRLNSRGGIEAVDCAFCAMTGFRDSQLSQMMLIDIMPPAHRTAFNRALSAVLRGRPVKPVIAAILPRDGEERLFKFYLGVSEGDAAPEEVSVRVMGANPPGEDATPTLPDRAA